MGTGAGGGAISGSVFSSFGLCVGSLTGSEEASSLETSQSGFNMRLSSDFPTMSGRQNSPVLRKRVKKEHKSQSFHLTRVVVGFVFSLQ